MRGYAERHRPSPLACVSLKRETGEDDHTARNEPERIGGAGSRRVPLCEGGSSMMRRLLAALFVTAAAFALTARADVESGEKDKKKPGKAELKGDPKILIGEAAAREAALKRQFELFKDKLIILAGRLEN